MKSWINRFALLTVVGSVLGSALVMGCGGGDDSSTTVTNTDANGNTTKSTTDVDK